MDAHWKDSIEPLLEAVKPRTMVEVGIASGKTTARLVDWAERDVGHVHAIDPAPAIDVDEWRRKHPNSLTIHLALSLDVLGDLEDVDVALIDGDHNWYTVYNELKQLAEAAKRQGRPLPLVLAHDVHWPYGRRDMYYDPESVPAEHRQEIKKAGMFPGRPELGSPGLNAGIWNAVEEGGPRNGVLTAFEDFAADHNEPCELLTVPVAAGLGVLAVSSFIESHSALRDALERLRSPQFLYDRLVETEEARLKAYIYLRTSETKLKALKRSDGDADPLRLKRIESELARAQRDLKGIQASRAYRLAIGARALRARIGRIVRRRRAS